MDRGTLRRIVQEKLKKKNNNSVAQEYSTVAPRITETNSNNSVPVDKNSPEVFGVL